MESGDGHRVWRVSSLVGEDTPPLWDFFRGCFAREKNAEMIKTKLREKKQGAHSHSNSNCFADEIQ